MVITIAGQCMEGKTKLAAWLTQQLKIAGVKSVKMFDIDELDDEAIMGLKDPDVLKPIIDKLDVQIITQQINRDFKDVDMNPLMNSLYKEIKI
jgi:CO dehydrogenase nickel-insertion accessory protein CooC1